MTYFIGAHGSGVPGGSLLARRIAELHHEIAECEGRPRPFFGRDKPDCLIHIFISLPGQDRIP